MSEKIVQLNEEVIKGQLKELVRGSVEETLNELLEAEAEKLTQAARYERNEPRQGYRSGHYNRNLTTTSGNVTLKVPKLKGISFETAIIERYRRRESSVEEALIEMYLAGVSVRRVEDITEALWGSKVSPSTISELNKKAYVHIEDWRNRPLQGGRYPYVYVDGIYLRRNWGGEFENVAILVAIAVNEDGYREVLGAAEGMKEDTAKKTASSMQPMYGMTRRQSLFSLNSGCFSGETAACSQSQFSPSRTSCPHFWQVYHLSSGAPAFSALTVTLLVPKRPFLNRCRFDEK